MAEVSVRLKYMRNSSSITQNSNQLAIKVIEAA